jgi:hypothetical protein
MWTCDELEPEDTSTHYRETCLTSQRTASSVECSRQASPSAESLLSQLRYLRQDSCTTVGVIRDTQLSLTSRPAHHMGACQSGSQYTTSHGIGQVAAAQEQLLLFQAEGADCSSEAGSWPTGGFHVAESKGC